MKFNIRNEHLINIINKIENGLNNKNVIEALNGIKIECLDHQINFITSRQDLSILYELQEGFEIKQTGSVIIPSKFLIALNKDGLGNITTIINDENQGSAQIKSQYSEINVLTYNNNTYPKIDFSIPDKNPIIISSKLFKKMYKATAHAAALIRDHQCFMGIHFQFENGKLTCSATDSRRLAIVSENLELNYQDSFILNKELYKIICSLLTTDCDIKIYHENNQLLLKFENYTIKCALINENYPDLQRLIIKEEEKKYKFNVNKNYLLPILDKIDELNKNVINPNLTISFDNNQGYITSEFQDFGNLKEQFIATDIEGKPISITLEPRFLRQAINALEDEVITIMIKDELSPLLITNISNKNNLQEISPIKR